MEHKMILMSADFREVHKVVVARRKHAGMAESLGADLVSQNTQVEILLPAPFQESQATD
jgi:hypothetical protein